MPFMLALNGLAYAYYYYATYWIVPKAYFCFVWLEITSRKRYYLVDNVHELMRYVIVTLYVFQLAGWMSGKVLENPLGS